MLISHSLTRTVPLMFLFFCVGRAFVQNKPRKSGSDINPTTRSMTVGPSCPDQPNNGLDAIGRLPAGARYWLTEDAAYIITSGERCAFLRLKTEQDRDNFIEQFWSRRSPDPRSFDNKFKREHYERIAFADEKYGTTTPGWKTDRGRVYVTFGAPDFVESHRAGEIIEKATQDGVQIFPYPWESWLYSHLDGIGENLEIGFVDRDGTGDYRLATSPEAIDAQLITAPVPFPKSSVVTQKGGQSLELHIGVAPTPLVQFKDLEAVLTTRMVRDQVRVGRTIEFSQATNATTLARIAIYPLVEKVGDSSTNKDSLVEFELFGRISKKSGWVVETFERKVSLHELSNSAGCPADCRFEAALSPGIYQLAIAIKNIATGDVGTLRTDILVPSYERLNAR